jgi:tetratricopeptide (TPR) repeat protein
MVKKSSATQSRRMQLLKRFLLVAAAVLVVLGIVGAVAFHFFQGWRARDLAGKALESFEQANYRAAWLQMNSARGLRPDDPAVLRASAIIESRFGMPTAMDFWDRFAAAGELSAEDLEQRGRAAAALGNDEQFGRAVDGLDAAGNKAAAGRLRTVRNLARGNMDRAIEEARRAVAATDDPAMKLDLARLLLRRHVERLAVAPQDPESQRIANEMFAIVDALQGTEAGEEALAFGLTFLLPGQEGQERWANLAMKNSDAANPALLPAATVMVDLGKAQTGELHQTLRPAFDAASLDRRAAFVAWLTRQGMPREALTLITAQEAGESTEAFLARTGALVKLENWSAVIEAADASGKAPRSLRLAAKARAEYALRQQAQSGAKSLAAALRAGAREGTLAVMVSIGDEIGGRETVDTALVELCGDPGVADDVFRMTRDRLSRRGPAAQALLEAAHARAMVAAPSAVAVQDYAHYVKLLAPPEEKEGDEDEEVEVVDLEETARAVAATPSDPAVRATHALALLQAGRAAEALAAFDDLTVFFARVPPGQQAVICRVLAEAGQRDAAEKASQSIDKELLTDGELRVLQGL